MTECLFFALWPDKTVRHTLSRWTRTQPAAAYRLIDRQNWHITLLFLGNVSDSQKNFLLATSGQGELSPFDLCLDHVEFWGHSRAVVLTADRQAVPRPMEALFQHLVDVAGECGLEVADRPYIPHLTLWRGSGASASEWCLKSPICWHIGQFVLLRSVPQPQGGVTYEELACWPLA
ncbi:MAG: RNA 2',3'-cyclic phosphodiesterase [Gammaproteobacteria bacterium]|nr:MAG: RNA 2',3'-cyclic phosphodiesterase [Gammaproteobacteria bacterium]